MMADVSFARSGGGKEAGLLIHPVFPVAKHLIYDILAAPLRCYPWTRKDLQSVENPGDPEPCGRDLRTNMLLASRRGILLSARSIDNASAYVPSWMNLSTRTSTPPKSQPLRIIQEQSEGGSQSGLRGQRGASSVRKTQCHPPCLEQVGMQATLELETQEKALLAQLQSFALSITVLCCDLINRQGRCRTGRQLGAGVQRCCCQPNMHQQLHPAQRRRQTRACRQCRPSGPICGKDWSIRRPCSGSSCSGSS